MRYPSPDVALEQREVGMVSQLNKLIVESVVR